MSVVLLLAILLLAFAREPVFFAHLSDAPMYLGVARTEPSHTGFDGKFFLIHPPAYTSAIKLASIATRDLVSGGVLVGLLASVALVLVTFELGVAIGLTRATSLAGALLLASTRALPFFATGVFREPLQVLLTYAVLLVVVRPDDDVVAVERGGKERLNVSALVVLGAIAALTFDPLALAAPLVLVASLLSGKPRRGLIAATSIVAVWLVWAEWRRETLMAEPEFPAGIDGLVEKTRPLSLLGALNPNFLSETRSHNAYFWPLELTPGRLARLVGPAILAPSSLFLDEDAGAAYRIAASLVLALAAVGAVAVVWTGRARRPLAVALPVLFLSLPALIGLQARYATTVVPLLSLLAAHGFFEIVRALSKKVVDERRASIVVLGLGGMVALATIARGPYLALVRPAVFDARSAAEAIHENLPDANVAAPVDLPSSLLWQLPDRRVLALPLEPGELDRFFDDHEVELLVLPLEVPVSSATPSKEEMHARSLATLGAIASKKHGDIPAFVSLGLCFEADPIGPPRLHAYQVLARRIAGRERHPFGVWIARGESARVALAFQQGLGRASELDALRSCRGLLLARGQTELAQALAK